MNSYFIICIFLIITIVYFWIYFKKANSHDEQIFSKMIGKLGVVEKDINKIGTVKIKYKIWKAKTDDGQIIKKGTKVQVVKVENGILIVKANIVSQIETKSEIGVQNLG